jgi:hypothetical protein
MMALASSKVQTYNRAPLIYLAGTQEAITEQNEKIVEGFRFPPPGLKAWVKTFIPEEDFKVPVPWTPVSKPLSKMTVALVTSAGISLKPDPPSDMDREKKEIFWGDRSYRIIPRGATARVKGKLF